MTSRLSRIPLGALLAALVCAGGAQAAGLDPTPPVAPIPIPIPAPQVADWSGFHGGLSANYARGHLDWEDNNGGFFAFAPGDDFDVEIERGAAGMQLGYSWQTSNNLVLGLELSGMVLDLEHTADSPYFGSDEFSGRIRNPLALTGQVGLARGRWQPYVEAGVASALVGINHTDNVLNEEFDSEEQRTGYVAGVGLGYKISDRFSVGMNYRHFDFGTMEHDGSSSPSNFNESFDVDARMGVVSVYWNYYLN
ncbi:outer membrane protein [Marinovum sp.]|uniref:outer membrane protein n=1 Tax=Marinovum sp. TaxID=2024839 RepID=UPI002B26A15E|nr:outer membrane beta-barrel protein [Marinovum sp.]